MDVTFYHSSVLKAVTQIHVSSYSVLALITLRFRLGLFYKWYYMHVHHMCTAAKQLGTRVCNAACTLFFHFKSKHSDEVDTCGRLKNTTKNPAFNLTSEQAVLQAQE